MKLMLSSILITLVLLVLVQKDQKTSRFTTVMLLIHLVLKSIGLLVVVEGIHMFNLIPVKVLDSNQLTH